ncbi:MAG TPA: 2-oxoglutarate dehydrogenase, E2 component, dihydrolipoamide succinyltransferase [Nocardioides sp.]|nr:2-oxoglutarate dehydrogenase, E2 component, dihydrolipoamide succinyltransferase [Nocardioides sp.]
MATEVNLPALGESVTEGTITRWLKQVGDEVSVDEPLLEVSTDKVDTEIPSPVAGTLLEIKAEEDDTVEVGAVLAMIGDEGEGGGSEDSGESGESEDSGESEESGESGESEDSAGGGEDVEQERAEQDSEERDSGGEAPSEQEPAAGADEDSGSEQQEEPAEEEEKPSGGGGGSGSGSPVTLPALGESVTEGTVTRWLKQVGDEVAVDEPLLEVSTDKVDTEIPSPVAGTLLEIKVEEDETVEVGAELAIVGSGDAAPSGGGEEESSDQAEEEPQEESEPEATEEPEPEAKEEPEPEAKEEPEAEEEPEPQKEEAAEEEAPAPEAEEPAAAAEKPDRSEPSTYVTPLVRKMAAQHDVDLSSITGTGVGGRIRKQDVLDAAKGKEQPAQQPAEQPGAASTPVAVEPSPLRGKTEPLTRLRKVIAKRMVESLQVSAQLTTVVEVDVTTIARLRASIKDDFASREGVKLSFMPFFAKAAIDSLKQHPSLNAAIDTEKGEVTYFDKENLAVAVDTEKGLLTPVIKEAGDLSIAGLARKIADVAERTRTNKITPDELSGGTFTLTNTGSRGALFDTPIINQPQVAILGTGSIVKRPVVIDDPNLGETIAVRSMVYLALTYDHRLVDGADAARFLTEVKQRLEAGQFEV